jgi:hypothetical protein
MRQARAGRHPSPTDEALHLFTPASSGPVREFTVFDAAWLGICGACSAASPGLTGPGGSRSRTARASSSHMTTKVGACDA